MPKLTRWLLKSSLISFVLALVVGAIMTTRSLLSLPSIFNNLTPIYFHLFLFGWVTQLIFGVVYWMFPKYSKENPHGSEKLGWLVFLFLNIGLLIRIFAEPNIAVNPTAFWSWMLAISAVLQWLAGVFFVVNTWGRVKGR